MTPGRVQDGSNISDLGGDSLDPIEIAVQVEDTFGLGLDPDPPAGATFDDWVATVDKLLAAALGRERAAAAARK